MTILQALAYFLSQALAEIRRGWKVSLLAILVTASSLFLGGLLALLGANLAAALEGWQSQARVVVVLEPGIAEEEASALGARLTAPFATKVAYVGPREAENRLRDRFPELDALLTPLERSPLPASFEIELAPEASLDSAVEPWLAKVRDLPGVAGVDDDRAWIRQLLVAATILRLGAAAIGGLLLAGSVFIITSVIRLAALVHREEIRVLRLVGATEFFVKGPFVVEGLLQGVAGALLALATLYAGFVTLHSLDLPELLTSTLLGSFLPLSWQLSLLGLGTGAGVLGGFLSLRRTAGGLW